jgi:hypothetical protein
MMRRPTRLLTTALILLAACPLPRPGHGAKAARGFARAAPVLTALAEYHARVGSYPDSLAALVPAYLTAAALATPDRAQERYPLEYQRDSTGFRLRFRYVGPGMNYCDYSAARPKWRCGGYF